MGSNTRNAYELKAGANKLEEINIAFELTEEALATVSAGSGQDIYLYSELSKNYAVTPFNENVYDPVHDVTTTDFSSYHWSVVSQTYASDAAAQYALAAAEAVKAEAGGTKAEFEAWEAEAEKLTADSYATQPYNEVVIAYTSNGDGTFTQTPTTEYSSLHYAEAAQFYSDTALANSEAVNLIAGMVMEWHSDRKPTGYLWCDGESYSVFSPTPAFAYDELYQVLVDPTYVMTTKPLDWDGLYPLNPNGWYNPADPDYQAYHDQSALPDTAELTLTVTVPDKRGVFTRGKDQAGTVLPARGIDSNGVVDFSTIKWSQNKAHTHILSNSYLGIRAGDGPTDDNNSGGPDAMDTITMSEEGGAEAYGTYQTANYIIRTKGVYNGDGSGSGGSSITPIASEIEYSDIDNIGYTNLQDSTQHLLLEESLSAVKRESVGLRIFDDVTVLTGEVDGVPIQEFRVLNNDWAVLSTTSGFYKISLDTGVFTLLSDNATVTFYTPLVSVDYVNSVFYAVGQKGGFGAQLLRKYSFDSAGTIVQLNELDIYALTSVNIRSIACSHLEENQVYITDSNSSNTKIIKVNVATGVSEFIETGVIRSGVAEHTSGYILAVDDTWGAKFYDGLLGSFVVLGANSYVPAFPLLEGTGDDKFNHSLDSNGDITVWTAEGWRTLSMDMESYGASVMSDVLTVFDGKTAGASNFHNAEYLPNRFKLAVSTHIESSASSPVIKRVLDTTQFDYKFYNAMYGGSATVGAGAYDLQSNKDGLNGGAFGDYSMTTGVGTKTTSRGGMAVGEHNATTDAKWVVGIGTFAAPLDGLFVTDAGDVQAPNRLAVPNPFSLLTKDIADTLYNLYTPTGHTGDIVVDSGGGTTVTTITVVDGLITTVAVV